MYDLSISVFFISTSVILFLGFSTAFKNDINSEELKWHRDREDRIVEVIENNNWFLQMDNEIPKKLIKGKKYYIPEGEYHRVIKGDGNLTIKVTLNKIIK